MYHRLITQHHMNHHITVMYLDHGHRWHDLALLTLFWGSAVLFIYVPMWTKDT